MIVHSDSNLWALAALLVTGVAVVMSIKSVSLFSSRRFAKAVTILAAGVGLLGAYVVAFIALTPQKTVTVGEGYCVDIWCIRIDKVASAPHGQEIAYKIDVHIFSDANRVQTSAKGNTIYLSDEQGRRFPLVPDSGVVPIDVTLNPGQSVDTSLTFFAAADAKHLYLMGDAEKTAPSWIRFLARMYSGGDPRPVLIRVV